MILDSIRIHAYGHTWCLSTSGFMTKLNFRNTTISGKATDVFGMYMSNASFATTSISIDDSYIKVCIVKQCNIYRIRAAAMGLVEYEQSCQSRIRGKKILTPQSE